MVIMFVFFCFFFHHKVPRVYLGFLFTEATDMWSPCYIAAHPSTLAVLPANNYYIVILTEVDKISPTILTWELSESLQPRLTTELL